MCECGCTSNGDVSPIVVYPAIIEWLKSYDSPVKLFYRQLCEHFIDELEDIGAREHLQQVTNAAIAAERRRS